MRDLWRDVRKGVSQLKRATAIMTVRCKPYLSGWFPNGITDISATFRIQPLVICSHRLFSGLAIDSVPIRDLASLSTILSDGVVQVGTIQTGTTVSLNRFRLRDHERASQDDLDDYLSVDSRYFRMFRQQMRTVRVRRGVAGGAVEKDTFSFQADPESIERGLEQLGARRLTADQVEIGPTVENQ